MSAIVLNAFQVIFTIGGVLGVIGFILEVPMAVVFAVVYANEKDELKKKTKLKWGIVALVAPFVLVIVSLLGVVIIQAVKAFV